MRRLILHSVCLMVLCAFWASPRGASSADWKGAVGSWHDPANWWGNKVPESWMSAIINNGGRAIVQGGASCSSLYVGSGGMELVAGNLAVGGDFTLRGGTCDLSGGRLDVLTHLFVLDGGSFTQTGGDALVGLGSSIGSGSPGALLQSGGTMTFEGSLDVGKYGGVGSYHLTGAAQLSIAGDLHVGDFGGGVGTFVQAGGSSTVGGFLYPDSVTVFWRFVPNRACSCGGNVHDG